MGCDVIWEKTTFTLNGALEDKEWDYSVDEGGGTFYGPKIDIKVECALGIEWKC